MNMLVMEETSTLSPRNECYAKMVSVKEKMLGKVEEKKHGDQCQMDS